MEAQLNEANTFPSQSYAQSFFSRLPTDNRFLQCAYTKVPPNASLDSKTLTFVMERLEAANVYMIQDACLEVRFKITTAAGALPTQDKLVAPRNNVLHSLWETCRISINDTLLTTNARDYHYKSYITTAISYSMGAKSTHLQTSGWYHDTSGFFNNSDDTNIGFNQRNRLFREDGDSTKNYKSDGSEFFGRIFHDLISCESGLPPNTKVKIELDRAPDSFVLQSSSSDNEKYQVKILNANLYVPVAQLSISVYTELSNYMARIVDGTFRNDVAIHYRRLEIRPVAIPNGNRDYYTKSLLSDSDTPCKVILCFVESNAKAGNYHNNPFEFRRSWEVEVSEAAALDENGSFGLDGKSLSEKMMEIETRMQSRLSVNLQNQLAAQFQDFTAMFLASTQQLLAGSAAGSVKKTPLNAQQIKEATATPSEASENLGNVNSSDNPVTEGNQRLENFIAATESREQTISDPVQEQLPVSGEKEISASGPEIRNLRSTARSRQASAAAASIVDAESVRTEYFSTRTLPKGLSAKKIQYIQNIACTLNSTPIDQVITFNFRSHF